MHDACLASFCSGEACCVQVPEWKETSIPEGHLPVPSSPVLQQISGVDGVCSTHHRAGGSAITEERWCHH